MRLDPGGGVGRQEVDCYVVTKAFGSKAFEVSHELNSYPKAERSVCQEYVDQCMHQAAEARK